MIATTNLSYRLELVHHQEGVWFAAHGLTRARAEEIRRDALEMAKMLHLSHLVDCRITLTDDTMDN